MLVSDKEVFRRLQLTSDLTLEKAIQTVLQVEDVAPQMSQQGEQLALNAPEVTHQRGGKKGAKQPAREKSDKQEQSHQGEPKCCRCGKAEHKSPSKCPALESGCRKCGKRSHWERQCLSKSVREVTNNSKDSEESFLNQGSANHWTEQITIGYTLVSFRIHTGADATIMNLKTFKGLRPKRHLEKYNGLLHSPRGPLDVVGQFTGSTLHKQKKYIFNIHVARGPVVSNLLSRVTAVEMGLWRQLWSYQAVVCTEQTAH